MRIVLGRMELNSARSINLGIIGIWMASKAMNLGEVSKRRPW